MCKAHHCHASAGLHDAAVTIALVVVILFVIDEAGLVAVVAFGSSLATLVAAAVLSAVAHHMLHTCHVELAAHFSPLDLRERQQQLLALARRQVRVVRLEVQVLQHLPPLFGGQPWKDVVQLFWLPRLTALCDIPCIKESQQARNPLGRTVVMAERSCKVMRLPLAAQSVDVCSRPRGHRACNDRVAMLIQRRQQRAAAAKVPDIGRLSRHAGVPSQPASAAHRRAADVADPVRHTVLQLLPFLLACRHALSALLCGLHEDTPRRTVRRIRAGRWDAYHSWGAGASRGAAARAWAGAPVPWQRQRYLWLRRHRRRRVVTAG
mmetsp:Transcript_42229/g.126558  ORF Transcript_42229/g.126558 Transcript_42229/m.126558 type:complete len:321 (+) Transcript_42229:434-1396(+)